MLFPKCREISTCLSRKYNVNCTSFCCVLKYSKSHIRDINLPDMMKKRRENAFRTTIQSILMIVIFTIEYRCYSGEIGKKSIFLITLYSNAKIISELIKTGLHFTHFSIMSYLVISGTFFLCRFWVFIFMSFLNVSNELSNETEFQEIFEL